MTSGLRSSKTNIKHNCNLSTSWRQNGVEGMEVQLHLFLTSELFTPVALYHRAKSHRHRRDRKVLGAGRLPAFHPMYGSKQYSEWHVDLTTKWKYFCFDQCSKRTIKRASTCNLPSYILQCALFSTAKCRYCGVWTESEAAHNCATGNLPHFGTTAVPRHQQKKTSPVPVLPPLHPTPGPPLTRSNTTALNMKWRLGPGFQA